MPASIPLTTDKVETLRTISAADLGGKGDWKVTVLRHREGISQGVETVLVDNGKLKFSVLATRGMGIGKAWLGDLEIGWKSPVQGPVHPSLVPVSEPSGLGWLVGFDELLVRCGLESNGAPEHDEKTGRLLYPLHGRIGNIPAHDVQIAWDDASGEIVVSGIVDEFRFHFLKLRMTSSIRTKPGSSTISVVDEIENISASPAEIQMLYHWNFGVPLLDGGSRLVVPAKTVVPRNDHAAASMKSWDNYQAPEPGFAEQVYFFDLAAKDDRTRVLLKNAHSSAGVSLVYNRKQLPCFSQWKDTAAIADGYVTGLEPATNFPNPRSFEGKQGRFIKLAGGGKTKFEQSLEIHPDAASVGAAEKEVAAIAGGIKAQVMDKPQATWCAP
jgi:hypothetical protein